MFKFALINESTLLKNPTQLQMMVDAALTMLTTFCQDWDRTMVHGQYYNSRAEALAAPTHNIIFNWVDSDTTAAGAEAYHDEIGGIPYARLMVNPAQANGAGVLDLGTANMSLLMLFTHELFETLCDEFVNDFTYQPNGKFLVKEVCDPVQSVPVPINLPGGVVYCSDYVTPRYFDSQAPAGTRFSYSGKITSPGQLLSGGYQSWFDPSAVSTTTGPIETVWGARVPEWLKSYRQREGSRITKRVAKVQAMFQQVKGADIYSPA